MSTAIPSTLKDAFFQLIQYPIQAAAQMNIKLLSAQLARHGKAEWKTSDLAFDSIASLTAHYNKGKWNGIMDFQPRKLPVFDKIAHTIADKPLFEEQEILVSFNAVEGLAHGTVVRCEELGYEGGAVMLNKEATLTFDLPECNDKTIEIEIRLVPTHPLDEKQLRFTLLANQKTDEIFS